MKQSQDEKKKQAKASTTRENRIGIYRDPASRSDQSGSASIPSCDQVEMRVHDLMDQRLPLLSDELVRNHIAQCDQCAELVVDFGALDDSLSQIPLATLQRLSILSSEESSQNLSRRPLHPFSFIVSIASLLLVMLTSGLWFSGSTRDAGPGGIEVAGLGDGTADNISSTSTMQVATTAPYGSPMPHAQIGSPSNPLIVHPGHKTSDPTEFINAVNFSDLRREFEPYLQMTADLPGMKPVTGSVNATFWLLAPQADSPADELRSRSGKKGDVGESPDLGLRQASHWQLCCV